MGDSSAEEWSRVTKKKRKLCKEVTSTAKVVIIKATDSNNPFKNPKVVMETINSSPFKSVYVKDTCRVLGKGGAFRIEIHQDTTVSLNDISELGKLKVQCWEP